MRAWIATDPRSEWTTVPLGARRRTALVRASTASWAVIRLAIEYPTIRLLRASFDCAEVKLPSPVG